MNERDFMDHFEAEPQEQEGDRTFHIPVEDQNDKLERLLRDLDDLTGRSLPVEEVKNYLKANL